jgi:hypothetical protein
MRTPQHIHNTFSKSMMHAPNSSIVHTLNSVVACSAQAGCGSPNDPEPTAKTAAGLIRYPRRESHLGTSSLAGTFCTGFVCCVRQA